MTGNANARQIRDRCLDAALNSRPCPASDPACNCLKALYAEDLLLGIRPDIATPPQGTASPQWTPLGTRRTKLEFLRISGERAKTIGHWELAADDHTAEGFVSPTALNDGGDTKIPPELFRYYNFGLGVELPLRDKNPENLSGAQLEMPIRTVISARSRSFPCLTHQHEYWVRVRAAFLDGSGLTAADLSNVSSDASDHSQFWIGAPTQPFQKPIVFLRTRQIGAPTVLLDRSSPLEKRNGETLITVVKREGDSPFDGEALTRVLAPPPMSPFEVYEHGERMVRNRRIIECLRFRGDEGTWPAHRPDAGPDLKAPQRLPYWRGALRKNRPKKMSYVFLPDILAKTLEITVTAGFYENQDPPAASVTPLEHFRQGTDWPFFRPAFLELHPAPKHQRAVVSVEPRPKDGRVRIYLRPGATANVEAQYVADHRRFLMGQQLFNELVPAMAQIEEIERHWLISQTTHLSIVHAVPQVIERPRFANLALQAPVLRESTVQLDCQALIHWASTAKIEIWAKWEDPVDNPGQNKQPGCEAHEILVKSYDVPEQTTAGQASQEWPNLTLYPLPGLSHALGDYKHHKITYGIRGISRYTSFFPPQKSPAFDWENEHTQVLSIPNRAPLDPLAPLHLIPLLRREFVSDPENHTVTHYRRARYLRLYFSRSFFTSGEGELAGFIFPQTRTGDHNTQNADLYGTVLGEFASVWGQPPAWRTSGGIFRPLSPVDFPGIQARKDLVITVSPDADRPEDEVELPVSVAGFQPWYDTKRELWCCDIPLPRHAVYRPLVRLTLVRYQPDSCDRLHTSSPVPLAFSSVMPDRMVSARRLNHEGKEFEVTMYGVAPLENYVQVASTSIPQRTTLELQVEERPFFAGKEFSWASVPFRLGDAEPKRFAEVHGQSIFEPGAFPLQGLVDDVTDVAGLTVWNARITIPERRAFHSYRLSLREREDWLVESDANAGAAPVPWPQLSTRVQGRYVFTDVIPI
jgi:hypothetical protein